MVKGLRVASRALRWLHCPDVSPSKVHKMMQAGALSSVHIDRTRLVRGADLQA